MAAANKIAALLVMCLVLVAAVQLPQAAAEDYFATCFKTCENECKSGGQGQTFCEMKCDTDCFNKEIDAKLKKESP